MGGLCSNSRSGGYKTDGAGDGGAGGEDEAKAAHVVLQGVHTDSVSCVSNCGALHPDYVASGGLDKRIVVNNWRTGETVTSWRAHDKAVNKIIWGDTINMLFSCSRDLSIRQWKLGTDTPLATLTGHTTNVAGLDISSDNATLCSGARDTSVRVWDVNTSMQLFQAQLPRNLVTCMKYIPNEPCFAQGAEDLAVRVWDPRSGALRAVQTFKGYVYFPLGIDVSADGNYILTSSKGFNSVGCELRVWDRRADKLLHQYTGHKQDAVACAYLPDSGNARRFVSASKDMTLRVWDQNNEGAALCQHMEFASGMFTSVATPAGATGDVSCFVGSFGGGVFAYKVGPAGTVSLVARTPTDQEGKVDA